MDNVISEIINGIIKAKWWVEKLYWLPTDIIWINEFSVKLMQSLESLVTKKEICFFDEEVKEFWGYHYLNFPDMFLKSEIMIIVSQISLDYFNDLWNLNPNILLVINSSFHDIISLLKEKWFWNNIIVY